MDPIVVGVAEHCVDPSRQLVREGIEVLPAGRQGDKGRGRDHRQMMPGPPVRRGQERPRGIPTDPPRPVGGT
jgi:hypothetical protein